MVITPQSADLTRHILLMVAGYTPAIITETLYALTQKTSPPFYPTEIHIITTAGAYDTLNNNLLGKTGKIAQLYSDYKLTPAPETYLHRIGKSGKYPQDITNAEENEIAADFITDKVRELTQDETAQLHVSIAGGRKTMSYYLGYAMSVFGRLQDRMSHVLVDENKLPRDFSYPDPHECIDVMLAHVPFVRLRDGIGFAEELAQGKHSFNETLDLIQRQYSSVAVVLNLQHQLYCSELTVTDLKPTQLAVYAWLLVRHYNGEAPLAFERESNQTYAEELLAIYDRLYEGKGIDKMKKALKRSRGMDAFYLGPHVSKCNKALSDSLKQAARHYLIQTTEKDGKLMYHLPHTLPAKSISLPPALQMANLPKLNY